MMPSEEAEQELLRTLSLRLVERFGPIVIWAFSASVMSDQSWIARMDYTMEGEDQRAMKGAIVEGCRDVIYAVHGIRARVFRERPSIAILRAGLIMLELESPDPGERVV